MQKTTKINKNNRSLLDKEMQKNIYKAEEDYIHGRIIDVEDLFKEWDIKYGVQN